MINVAIKLAFAVLAAIAPALANADAPASLHARIQAAQAEHGNLAAMQLTPSAGISGSWYDPAKSGQGFTIQYLGPTSALLTWFTYDTQGKQRWMQGVGQINGQTIEFELLRLYGPRFGPGFDASARVTEMTGTLTLTFESCEAGRAVYSGYGGPNGLPADTLDIVRLTTVAGVGCGGGAIPTITAPLHKGINGAWYDPSHNGEGWMVELLGPNSALIYWFTYDDQGQQAWMLAVAEIAGNTLLAREVARPIGGRFGPNYDPGQVVQHLWGAFGMSVVGCNKNTLAYFGPSNFGSGGFGNIQRIVGVDGAAACNFPGGLRKLAGTLEAAPFSQSDGDTNDPGTPLRANNTPAQVQPVSANPVAIAGFAAQSGVGGQGRFGQTADAVDAYRLNLTAGQTLQLIIADWTSGQPGRNDLDLWLYDAGNTSQPVATSETTSRNEFIQITRSGSYDVVVVAYAGASNYSLVASFAPVPQGFQGLSSLDDFVPGEMIVRFDEDDDEGLTLKSAQAVEGLQASRAGAMGLELKQAAIQGPVLMQLPPEGSGTALSKVMPWDVSGVPALLAQHGYAIGRAGDERRHELVDTLKALRSQPGVRYAEPNRRVYLQSLPPDPDDWRQAWHYNQINMPAAWAITPGSSDVVVAVIDSGVADHPDLNANVLRNLGATIVSGGLPPPPQGRPGNNVHGTHVAGTIAAVAGNGYGGKGVAPGVKIMPVNAFSVLGTQGGFTDWDVAHSLRYAAGLPGRPGLQPPARKANVINMSLGGPVGCPTTLQDAIDAAVAQGLIVIAAAGNEGSNYNVSPAGCRNVTSVSATDRHQNPAFYSNCGSHVDVAAPGGETEAERPEMTVFSPGNPHGCRSFQGGTASAHDGIYSTIFPTVGASKYFEAMPGTSMAAPHVAGVAALMKSVHPGLTPAQFDQLLASGQLTRDIGAPGRDNFFGHGLIDARKAVEAARNLAGGTPAPAVLIVEPASLDFADATERMTVTLRKSGSGPLTVTGATPDQAWLQSLTPQPGVTPEGFGNYELRINRQGQAPGGYQGRVRFHTLPASATPVELDIGMRVGQPPSRGDAGLLYLLVIDAFTGQLIDLYAGTGNQGRYRFDVPDLVPGAYLLVSTSDNDFDRTICDAGEFCGFYPNQPGGLVLGNQDLDLGVIAVYPDTSGLGQTSASGNIASDLDTWVGKISLLAGDDVETGTGHWHLPATVPAKTTRAGDPVMHRVEAE